MSHTHPHGGISPLGEKAVSSIVPRTSPGDSRVKPRVPLDTSQLNPRRRAASSAKTGKKAQSDDSVSHTLMERERILREIGHPEMIALFNDWTPRVSQRRRRAAPLDQRVAISVTDAERQFLDQEIQTIAKNGSRTTMAAVIRSRALGSVDLSGWKEIAIEALKELDDIEQNQAELRKRYSALQLAEDEEENEEEAQVLRIHQMRIKKRLAKLSSDTSATRNNRLTGRMSMKESEMVKWRASRLCIPSSDYLRMMIFGLTPDSIADAHMSLDSRRRFYISIIEVANKGWGSPPNIYECDQCANYVAEIDRLNDLVLQLRSI